MTYFISKVNDESRAVQACITSVGFPDTLGAFQEMIEKNLYKGNLLTDMDMLLDFRPNDQVSWTSPKWLTQGDVLFFYHTKRALRHTTQLLRQTTNRESNMRDLAPLLNRAVQIAAKYSGAIFGCAEIAGAAEYHKSDLYHFESRFFAPLARFHVFEHPLRSEIFSKYIKISQNTITPLYGQEFDGVKALLSEHNNLPCFLRVAGSGVLSFRTVNRENWPTISCNSDTRFICEAQLRAYLLDHLFRELKDTGTAVLEECQCYRNSQKTGTVDYFVRICGHWIPVEAKLNILAERDLMSQIAKYVKIDTFVPTKGSSRSKIFQVTDQGICIVADQSGIYVVRNGEFFGCALGDPIWRRESLDHSSAHDIRSWMATILTESCLAAKA